jgi:hypothetical protein
VHDLLPILATRSVHLIRKSGNNWLRGLLRHDVGIRRLQLVQLALLHWHHNCLRLNIRRLRHGLSLYKRPWRIGGIAIPTEE